MNEIRVLLGLCETNTDQNFISHFNLFSNCIVGVDSMQGIVLAAWDTARNKTDKNPCLHGAYVLKGSNRQ